MVHTKKILFTESGGSKNKVVLDFEIGHFCKKPFSAILQQIIQPKGKP